MRINSDGESHRACGWRFSVLWIALVIGLTAMSSTAVAAPVKWTLVDVTFSDGGTASGSFMYDADTNVFSAVDITTISGTLVTGANLYLYLQLRTR